MWAIVLLVCCASGGSGGGLMKRNIARGCTELALFFIHPHSAPHFRGICGISVMTQRAGRKSKHCGDHSIPELSL